MKKMSKKQKLVEELIKSLNNEPENWRFNEYTADNNNWGVGLWIANATILNLTIYRPTELSLSLVSKIRLYKAINNCKLQHILKLKEGK